MISVSGFIQALFGPILDAASWLTSGGDPVDLGSGLFVSQKTDLYLPDIMPLALTRTYRQEDTVSRDVGVGTTNSYNLFLSSTNQYQVADLNLPDGGRVHYIRTSPGTGYSDAVFGTTTTPSQFYASTISWNGNGWNLRLTDGTVYVFGVNQPLQAIRDRNGNQITLTRQSGNITQITSPSGRYIQLSYVAGTNTISQARDSIGRVVQYSYDSKGRLHTVTDPTNGGVTTYTYDDSNPGNAAVSSHMLTITDARNITYITNHYDASGRVDLQTMVDGSRYQFSYTTDPTTHKITETDVTDPRLLVRKVMFNGDGFIASDMHAFGQPHQQTTTYNRQAVTGFINSIVDPLNRTTSFVYDGSGNVTSTTSLSGTANAVTTSTVYEPVFNKPTLVTDPNGHSGHMVYDAKGN